MSWNFPFARKAGCSLAARTSCAISSGTSSASTNFLETAFSIAFLIGPRMRESYAPKSALHAVASWPILSASIAMRSLSLSGEACLMDLSQKNLPTSRPSLNRACSTSPAEITPNVDQSSSGLAIPPGFSFPRASQHLVNQGMPFFHDAVRCATAPTIRSRFSVPQLSGR